LEGIRPPKSFLFVVSKYTLHSGGAGAAKPPPQNIVLWCGAAKPRRTTTHIEHVLAQHKNPFFSASYGGFAAIAGGNIEDLGEAGCPLGASPNPTTV